MNGYPRDMTGYGADPPAVNWPNEAKIVLQIVLDCEEGDFACIADSHADVFPYWARAGGKDQLIVPCTIDCNDMRFTIQAGFTNGDQVESYLRNSFDMPHAEGETGAPKMLSIGLRARIACRPDGEAALQPALAHFRDHDAVRFATRAQIADHWAAAHPPRQRARPPEIDKERFVAEFCGVFEHSPWIAKGAYEPAREPTHDTATGIHRALARVFRTASDKQRLGVLVAHPDRAGKLAAAKRLTAESTADHASAGLDALTDEERQAFTELNETYTVQFGVPFIIAVRDDTRASISAAHTARVDNNRETEFIKACRQAERIAERRLQEKLAA